MALDLENFSFSFQTLKIDFNETIIDNRVRLKKLQEFTLLVEFYLIVLNQVFSAVVTAEIA